jgi:hypothetical protein
MDARRFVAQTTICQVRGHKWTSAQYPNSEESGAAGGSPVAASRCSKECLGDLPQAGVSAQKVRRM